jgi:uncharacterized tellurite resistance protein B-like protein
MSFLKLIGLQQREPDVSSGDTDTVRKIVKRLESMDSEKARHVAAFAYILGRVAHADLDISPVETRSMEETENFLVTREFVRVSNAAQRAELLDCLFAVSAADQSISGVEEAQIRQIASELGFSHRQFVEARSAYSEHREVLKPFRSKN